MKKAERFRYELIDVIVKDSKRLMDAMVLYCKIEIDGLNRSVARVSAQARVGALRRSTAHISLRERSHIGTTNHSESEGYRCAQPILRAFVKGA